MRRLLASLLVGVSVLAGVALVAPASRSSERCQDTGVIDALAMRNYRLYDNSESLIPDVSDAVWIDPGDPLPRDASLVLYRGGGARPFIQKAAAQKQLARNQNATADLWVHTTGRICDLLVETHEHVDAYRGVIRRDFYKWKYAFGAGSISRLVPYAGWHRFDAWQQRSNGSTIMDIHCCGQERDTGRSRLEAEVSWETP